MAADLTWYNLYISPSAITSIVLDYTYNGYNYNNTLNKNASGYFDIEFPDVNDLVLTIKAEGYKDYIINYSYGMGTTSLEITMTEDFSYISKFSINGNTYEIKDATARTSISNLATVATTGSYNDLSNKPTIPTVNNSTITIQKNSTTVDSFTTNASSGKTINITVPTNTNELTNGAGFITSSSLPGVATSSTAGLVKPDGTTITIDANGTISSASSVDIDEETITENSDNKLQVVAVKNKRDDSTLPIWHGTEYQWNHVVKNWYNWKTNINLNSSTISISNKFDQIAYGNNVLIGIRSNSSYYSEDKGLTWIKGGPLSVYGGTLTFINNTFIVMPDDFSNSEYISYSEDNGRTWQTSILPYNIKWGGIHIGNDVIIITEDNSDSSFSGYTRTAYSEDNGKTWVAGGNFPIKGRMHALVYGSGCFMTVSRSNNAHGHIICSVDKGRTWINRGTSTGSNNYYNSLTYNGRVFVINSVYSTDVSKYSEDNGITWVSGGKTSSSITTKLVGGDGITFGIYNENLYYSDDNGITWIKSTVSPSLSSGVYLEYNFVFEEGIIYTLARSTTNKAYFLFSEDKGRNWKATITSDNAYPYGTLVYVGDNKYVNLTVITNDYSRVLTQSIIQYDKCYTDTANPTIASVIYSAPETQSALTISSVTSGAITLSDNNTYYYNQSGNAFTYRTIGDAHPEYLAFIDGVGVKMGNNWIATNNSNNS